MRRRAERTLAQKQPGVLHSSYTVRTKETGRNEFGNATRAQVEEG